jgi:hypothetical protein
MEYLFPRLRKNHISYCITYRVIMDVVAKEERKGDKVFDGGEGVQMDLKIADLPRQFQSLTGHFR